MLLFVDPVQCSPVTSVADCLGAFICIAVVSRYIRLPNGPVAPVVRELPGVSPVEVPLKGVAQQTRVCPYPLGAGSARPNQKWALQTQKSLYF